MTKLKTVIKARNTSKKQVYISMILFQFSRQEINEALVLHNKSRFYVAQRLGHQVLQLVYVTPILVFSMCCRSDCLY